MCPSKNPHKEREREREIGKWGRERTQRDDELIVKMGSLRSPEKWEKLKMGR